MARARPLVITLVALIAGLGLTTPHAQALESESARITLQGFGTLGMARSNETEAEFVRDLSQPYGLQKHWTGKLDSQLGVQASIELSAQTQGVVQAISRYHANDSFDPELSWAFLRHDFTPDLTVRLGRLGTEFFMLGDTRMVGYSNLPVRPPGDFYGSLVFSYVDGLDVSLLRPLANGVLKTKLYAGYTPEQSPLVGNILWELDGSLLLGGYLDYSRGSWQMRLSHAQIRFRHDMPFDELLRKRNPAWAIRYLDAVPGMSTKRQWSRFSSIGVVYDDGPLQAQLMLNKVDQDSSAYEDSHAGYLLAGYRIGSFTPYLGYSRVVSSPDGVPLAPGHPLYGLTKALQDQTHNDQNTWTVGTRWDFRKNMALKAQADFVRGEPTSDFPVRQDTPAWDGKLNVYSLTLDFVF